MTRPRSSEDLDALQLRARLRLERRMRDLSAGKLEAHGWLAREAAALVAALDALRDDHAENMERWAHGDR